jgi:thioredoxin 2
MIECCRACGAANQVACARLDSPARCSTCLRSLLPLARPHALHSKAELEELLAGSPLPVVVDFWSPANDCGALGECELERVARVRSGDAVVATLNTQEVPDAAASFGVSELPTLIVFRGGREEARSAGPDWKALLRAV